MRDRVRHLDYSMGDRLKNETVASLDCVGDTNDLWLDATAGRVYLSGGEGLVSVFARGNGGDYQPLARVSTAPGARTSYFAADTRMLYVAAPHRGQQKAELLVFRASRIRADVTE
jgi:hypothetical protein